MKLSIVLLFSCFSFFCLSDVLADDDGRTQDMVVEQNKMIQQKSVQNNQVAIDNSLLNNERNLEIQQDRQAQAIIKQNQNIAREVEKETKKTERATTSIFGPGTLSDQKAVDELKKKKQLEHADAYDFSTNQQKSKVLRESQVNKGLSNPSLG